AKLLGVPLARGGRVPVRADLSLEGHPEVFAIGDIAASPSDDERPLPQVAHGLRFSGRIGWLMWLGLHLLYLIGFRNRLAVLVNWSWNYLTYDHSARTLVESTASHSASPVTEATEMIDPSDRRS